MKKVITISIIVLFIGMGFQPILASSTNTLVVNKIPLELIIDGPSCGVVGSIYYYTFCINDTEAFKLFIDWGDGTYEDWFGVYGPEIELGHIWYECGNYTIRAIAIDIHNRQYDGTLDVTIIENNPPNPPMIDGPRPKVGEEYEYSFWTEDPDGDNISYYVEWGDGTSDGWSYYIESGHPIYFGHKWEEIPEFIRAKAKDTYEVESEWSYWIIRDKSSNLELNNVEDCDCQTVEKYNPIIVKHLLNKVKFFTILLLSRFEHIPEVKENCNAILDILNSYNPFSIGQVICAIALGIYLEMSSMFTRMWEFQEYILENYLIFGIIYTGLLYISCLPLWTIHYFIGSFIIIYCS